MPRVKKGAPHLHPAQRFVAPPAIARGATLKRLIGPELIGLLAESLVAVAPDFDAPRFRRRALDGLDRLELKGRGAHVAAAIAEQLPGDFRATARILIGSLGPELAATERNGLAPFFYLPHSFLIAELGPTHFESGMQANYELTKRFTAEFSIRPLLVAHPARCLKRLARWTQDPNPHVRRLVSEGTRPRLPWAARLTAFQADPQLTLPLLERLKDDPEPYVRRSVANHLGDILKDHPDAVFATCQRWTEEASELPPEGAKARFWIVRHALRLPAKRGDRQALRLQRAATGGRRKT